jgi:hypothetical protein
MKFARAEYNNMNLIRTKDESVSDKNHISKIINIFARLEQISK